MLVIWTFRSSRKMILVSPTAWGVRTTVRSSCAVASTIFGFPINTVLNDLSSVNVDIKLSFRATVCRQGPDRRPGWQAAVTASSARVADVATTNGGAIAGRIIGARAVTGRSGAIAGRIVGARNALWEGAVRPPSRATAELALSDEQRGRIYEGVMRIQDASVAYEPAPAVADALPSAVPLQDLPAGIAREVPLVQGHKFVKFDDRIVVVDPKSRVVVAMIPRYKLLP
jgi:Protein of unknown function (DUF1236)